MSNALVALNELERMAAAFAKSGMFGAKTPEQAMALLLLAQGEGLHPAIAMRDFHVIQGRPAKKAEAMLRSFIESGGKVEWHCMTDEKADATFSHPQGGTVRIDWDMKRMKQAEISNAGMYNKYPRQMLANRVISEGCRRVYPASTSGLYVPEEVVHFQREKDITPTAGSMAALPIKEQEIVMETSAQVKELIASDKLDDAYALWQNSNFDNDQKVAFWSTLNSKQRGVLDRMWQAEQDAQSGGISTSQKKRLEALIKESKLDREGLKNWCTIQFGKGHFAELTKDEYKELDTHISTLMVPKTNAALPASSPKAEPSPATQAGAATQYISNVDLRAIEIAVEAKGIKARFNTRLANSNIPSPDKIPADKVEAVKKWVTEAK